MSKYVEQFISVMLERGFDINTIRYSYLTVLKKDEDFEEILKYISNNDSASKEDINYEIHKIHLKKRGVNI